MKFFVGCIIGALACAVAFTSWADETKSEYIQVAFDIGLVHGLSISDLVKQANPGKKISHTEISLASFSAGADELTGIALSGFWSGVPSSNAVISKYLGPVSQVSVCSMANAVSD